YPTKIVRINKSDFSTITRLTLANNENYADSLVQDNDYLYVGTDVVPHKIIRINKSDFSTTESITLVDYDFPVLTQDDDYVYVGTNDTPATVLRIEKADTV